MVEVVRGGGVYSRAESVRERTVTFERIAGDGVWHDPRSLGCRRSVDGFDVRHGVIVKRVSPDRAFGSELRYGDILCVS